jgi:hypothetical protein
LKNNISPFSLSRNKIRVVFFELTFENLLKN